MRRGALQLTALAAAALIPATLKAQTGSSVIVNQGQKAAPRAAAPARPAEAAAAPAAPAPPQITPFVLRHVVVEDSTVPAAVLARAWTPWLGKSIDGAALLRIVDAVGEAERHGGVALYNVVAPDQDFAGGVLRLEAVEGHISEVVIEGGGEARGVALARAYGARLTAERPLRRATLERYVSLIRDIPGLNADLDLKPGSDAAAETLTVKLRPQAVQVAAAVNNRGAALLGRTQVEADLFLNGLLRPGDQTRLAIAVPTEVRRFQYYALNHATPLGEDGTTLQLGLSYLRTRPEGIDLTGDAQAASVQVSRPVLRSYADNLYLTAALDGLNSNNALLGVVISNDRTRAARLGLAFSHETDTLSVVAGATASQGLDALGARVSDPALSEVDFRKLNLKLAVNVQVAPRLILRLNGAAQLTADRLPAAEQFALGGEEFGRAFEAASIAGDEGQAGSAELAWRPAGLPAAFDGSEAYVFADSGQVTFKSRLGLPAQTEALSSAGGGVRLSVSSHAIVELEAARALHAPVLLSPGGAGWRGVFSLKSVF